MKDTTRRAFLVATFLSVATSPALGQMAPPLVAAAEQGDGSALRKLLNEHMDTEARDSQGRTALLAATHANQIEAARLLIGAGADVDAKDDIEDSRFLYARAEGRDEILKLTLSKADLRSVNRFGATALIPAAHHGHVETVRILLGTGINVDHVNNLGWTALVEAVILGNGRAAHTQIVRILVAAGARTNLADRDGVTPLAHAKQQGFGSITEIQASGGTSARRG